MQDIWSRQKYFSSPLLINSSPTSFGTAKSILTLFKNPTIYLFAFRSQKSFFTHILNHTYASNRIKNQKSEGTRDQFSFFINFTKTKSNPKWEKEKKKNTIRIQYEQQSEPYQSSGTQSALPCSECRFPNDIRVRIPFNNILMLC